MKPKLKKMKCKKSLTRFPEYRDKNKSYFLLNVCLRLMCYL